MSAQVQVVKICGDDVLKTPWDVKGDKVYQRGHVLTSLSAGFVPGAQRSARCSQGKSGILALWQKVGQSVLVEEVLKGRAGEAGNDTCPGTRLLSSYWFLMSLSRSSWEVSSFLLCLSSNNCCACSRGSQEKLVLSFSLSFLLLPILSTLRSLASFCPSSSQSPLRRALSWSIAFCQFRYARWKYYN